SSRRHTRFSRDWSSDVCSSDLPALAPLVALDIAKALAPIAAHAQIKLTHVLVAGQLAGTAIHDDATAFQNIAIARVLERHARVQIGRASCREREYMLVSAPARS